MKYNMLPDASNCHIYLKINPKQSTYQYHKCKYSKSELFENFFISTA